MTQPQAKPREPHPASVLLRRYRDVFKAAWERRHDMVGPTRLVDELAFLPATLSLQDTPVHPAPRRIAWAIILLFLAALAWAMLGQVDIVAVAQGRIIVDDRTKVIQPLETSVVRRLLVKDGDTVVAGQVLVELDPTMARADKANLAEQIDFAVGELVRSAALFEALEQRRAPVLLASETPRRRAQLLAEWEDIQARLSHLDAEIATKHADVVALTQAAAKSQASLPMLRAREADFKELAAHGYVSSHAAQDKIREAIEMERDLATQRARIEEARMAVEQARKNRAAYLAETRRQLEERAAQAKSRHEQLQQEQAKAIRRESLTFLTAPVDGVVQQLAIHTEGGVAPASQPLMVIVPRDGAVLAEVVLENKDIGFVESGQAAVIKMDTFPYTRYGTLPASVKLVAADAVNDEKKGAIFPAILSLERSSLNIDGKSIQVSPGMSLSAEIKTGRRRVIDYLLSPIEKYASESMRER